MRFVKTGNGGVKSKVMIKSLPNTDKHGGELRMALEQLEFHDMWDAHRATPAESQLTHNIGLRVSDEDKRYLDGLQLRLSVSQRKAVTRADTVRFLIERAQQIGW